MSPVWLIVVLLAVVAVLLGVSAVSAFRRRAPVSGGLGLLVAVLVLALAGATGAAAWSLARYEALTRETLAAVIRVEPTGPSRFRAEVEMTCGLDRRADRQVAPLGQRDRPAYRLPPRSDRRTVPVGRRRAHAAPERRVAARRRRRILVDGGRVHARRWRQWRWRR